MSNYKKKRLNITLLVSLFIISLVIFLGVIGNVAVDINQNIKTVDNISEEIVIIEEHEIGNGDTYYSHEVKDNLNIIEDITDQARESLRKKSRVLVYSIKVFLTVFIVFGLMLIYYIRKISEEDC